MEQEKEPSKLLVPGAIVVAGALIALAIYTGGSGTPDKDLVEPKEIQVAQVDENDHILGSRNADIIIVEYSDTECPFCKVFHETMKDIVSSNDGNVAWVYRHLPIQQLHARAMKEAEATECAAELGGNQAFWSYLDKIFELTNSNDSLDPGELPRIATSIGLNEQEFTRCLSSGKYVDDIEKSIEEGYAAGARGTPYSIMISKKGEKTTINGAEPFANIQAKIDTLID